MFAAALENTNFFSILISEGADMDFLNQVKQSARDIIKQKKTYNPYLSNIAQYMKKQYYSPQVSCINPTLHPNIKIRKSSNISPIYITSPQITPITPMTPIGFVPQIFFPNNFQASMMSPYIQSPKCEMMNVRMNEMVFASPVPYMNFQSPNLYPIQTIDADMNQSDNYNSKQ